ncbi:hypothetical protein [Alloyangia pacifica]|uniref:hypothetical protein n=1 Tax=Alloyangia pacifica TaxID=311180 RepID=UPI001CFEE673|nr:hypothetical protein [Alloyangia pacifica]
MTVSDTQSAELVLPLGHGSKQVNSAVVDHVEKDDVGTAWLGASGVPDLVILDGGPAFRSQKFLQAAFDLAVTSSD